MGLDHGLKWYQVPLLRKWMVVTLLVLILLIGVSLSPDVNVENQAGGILATTGRILLINMVFVCSAALQGGMFFILKTINQKVNAYTL